ncbi:MAG TPA: hypothetical protein VGC41_01875, partial [Kofleriaceae bacterium]
IDVTVRDRVAAKYDSDDKSWKALTNAQDSDLAQVKLSCTGEYASVNAQLTGKCDSQQALK